MSVVYRMTKGAAYFAGLNLPFFVSAATVAQAARERGFAEVQVTPRARARFAFEVRKVPGYSDDWDHAFFGIYEGDKPQIEVPENPPWLFEVRPQIPPPGKTVVAQVVAPVRPGVIAAKAPEGTRALLWIAGGVAVVVAARWALQPAKRA